MRSYENALPENTDIPRDTPMENLKRKDSKFIEKMTKSLNCLIGESQTMQQAAKIFRGSGTKLFVESFLFNIESIKKAYQPIKPYLEAPAESHSSCVKDNSEENEIENIPEIADIESKIKEIAAEIISKSEGLKSCLRSIKQTSDNDSFANETYGDFEDLNDTILKLDLIEKMIEAYSK
jgi:hypothetical protein